MHALPPLISSSIEAITIRLLPGNDLKMALDGFVKKHAIRAACVVTCVGSLQQVSLRFANQQDKNIITGKFEILSLTGTLSETGSHLHICISDSEGKTIGGHLKEGSIIFTTAEVVIGLLPAVVFDREIDPAYGCNELVVRSE